MKRFVEGEDRRQGVLLPGFLDDYVAEGSPVRAIDVFVDELGLHALGFAGVRRRRAALPIIPPRSTATATSIRSSRIGVWSAKRRAMSR
jgi:hypothetical protein